MKEDTKDDILYDILEKAKLQECIVDWSLQRAKWEGTLLGSQKGRTFWDAGNVLYLDCGGNYMV